MTATNSAVPALSRWRRSGAGLVAGTIAGVVMTAMMLLLAAALGLATPLVLIGDRISVLLPVDAFLALMGKVGGYNRMKQLGVSSVIIGQIVVGAGGGVFYALALAHLSRTRQLLVTLGLFILLPLIVLTAALWPVLGTHFGGLPIRNASIVTLLGLLVCLVAFERTLVLSFSGLTRRPRSLPETTEFSPPIARRALILGGLGLLVTGGGAALLRRLYQAATFSYDGKQYRGADVQPITPNDQFYCVTKNVIDPVVDDRVWRLEVSGLVQTRQRYRIERLKNLKAVTQETTLMCISNGIDAGLISHAVWTGVPMRTLLEAASPSAGATRVRLHGVDNYTDTIPLEKALDPSTLIVYAMNGEALPQRHGFPARAIVPGYFGEKHVKWITRIELAGDEAQGFYEKQGWGPNFIIPTRSRIDQPPNASSFDRAAADAGIVVKGIAFGGDRGISRVEISVDDGNTWADAKLDYPGTRLSWALWSFDWRSPAPEAYTLVVRATNGDGELQAWDPERPFTSGATGFHKVVVYIG